MKLLLAALALGTPLHGVPAAPVAAAPAFSDANQLAELMLPQRTMIDLVMAAARSQSSKGGELAAEPDMANFVLARMQPEIERIVGESLPELRAEIARIIAADMTPAEIDDVYTFFASPTGQRLQQTVYAVIAENPMASPEAQQSTAVERFMSTLTPDDYPALTAFGTSAGAKKLRTVTPKTNAAAAAWAQRLLTRHGPRFDQLRAEAIAEYRRQPPVVAK